MEPLRVGFVGCGRHATKMLYPSLHLARMDLVAVCDMDQAAAGVASVSLDHHA